MPTKSKQYQWVTFPESVITQAVQAIVEALPSDESKMLSQTLSVHLPSNDMWLHDTDDEFFIDYRQVFQYARFRKQFLGGHFDLTVSAKGSSDVSIGMPTRTEVEHIFDIFDTNAEVHRREPPPDEELRARNKVFVGHGRSQLWRDLKDHLHEMHGMEVEAYEMGARAGLTIRDVLDDMLTNSSFALLVLAAEDQDVQGLFHARENVIHELGLFQARLGWRRAIIILEEGVEEFSNIHGINQIRFSQGNIRETFGDVVATIEREFGRGR